MSDWNPDLYLKFEKERTQPAIDLAARISHADPGDIIDIGCGPGNSTQVLKNRWPHARITGLDSSAQMIEQAKAGHTGIKWVLKDASEDLSAWENSTSYSRMPPYSGLPTKRHCLITCSPY